MKRSLDEVIMLYILVETLVSEAGLRFRVATSAFNYIISSESLPLETLEIFSS